MFRLQGGQQFARPCLGVKSGRQEAHRIYCPAINKTGNNKSWLVLRQFLERRREILPIVAEDGNSSCRINRRQCGAKVSSWLKVTPKSQTEERKVRCGYFSVSESRAILVSCWSMPSQISWALARLSPSRFEETPSVSIGRAAFEPGNCTSASLRLAMHCVGQ